MTDRIFIALELPIEVKQYIHNILQSIDPLNKMKWESAGKMHVTLKFLGETEKSKVEEVKDVLDNFVIYKKPVKLELNKFGFFKRNGIPQILWAGFEKSDLLFRYFENLEELLLPLGFKKEKRSFCPHITLKRLKGKEDKLILEKFLTLHIKPYSFLADSVVLFKSELNSKGAVYKKIKINKFE